MASFTVTLERVVSKRSSKIEEQLEFIVSRATAGNRKAWSCTDYDIDEPKSIDGDWRYKAHLTMERKPGRTELSDGRLQTEMDSVMEVMAAACANSKFNKFPWTVKEYKPKDFKGTGSQAVPGKPAKNDKGEGELDVNDIVDFEKALLLDEIVIPDILISGTDAEIEKHPAFSGIYGRAPHIRVIFSSIKTMIDTQGMRRNHVLLYGLPGCAKSSIFRGVQTVLGKGAYIAINANSATRAGIEAIFIERLKQTGCPPFFFIEEIEKTLEAILTVWLSIFDERAEVRKVTFTKAQRADARVLGFATANDKVLFDRLMGGRPGHPGALSSRFNKPLYVSRPSREIMKRILLRDIDLYGGKKEWAEPCLDIATEMNTNDPRIVLGYLDGQDRLLSGEYRDDILAIRALELEDKGKVHEAAEEEEVSS